MFDVEQYPRFAAMDTARQLSHQRRLNCAQGILDFGLIRQIRRGSTFARPRSRRSAVSEDDRPLPPIVQQARLTIWRLRCGPEISGRGLENPGSARHAGARNE